MTNDIYITLDYELCLGEKTGSVKNTIIRPMEKLAEVFDRYNVKVTLMVDSSYLYMLNKNKNEFPSLEDDYNLIVSQLKSLSDAGHSIQLHIHPQWYYSRFDGNEWKMDFDHYKLSDMSDDDVTFYFKESRLLLESIIGKKVMAFRAGGFSLQSYKDHSQLLISNNIKIDTSVVPGAFEKSKNHWYDFRDLPHKPYRFSENITKIDKHGALVEMPVSTVSFNPIKYLLLRKKIEYTQSSFKPSTEGRGIVESYSKYRKWFNLYRQLFRTKFAAASIDNFSSCLLPLVYKKYKAIPGNNCFVIIGHPKSVSQNSIRFTEEFIKKTVHTNKYKTLEDFLS